MKEIELSLNDNIESAVYTLLAAKARGEHAWCYFNGHVLCSDNITMDSAYKEVTGYTKEEFKQYLVKRKEEFERKLAEEKAEEQAEMKLVSESKKKHSSKITQQLVVDGLKFITENQNIPQHELVKGLLELGCNFTLEDIRNQFSSTSISLFEGIRQGDLASGASIIANVRQSSFSRSFVDDRFLSVDNDVSIYNYIRIVTGDMTYTKEKITSMNDGPKLNKNLK